MKKSLHIYSYSLLILFTFFGNGSAMKSPRIVKTDLPDKFLVFAHRNAN